MDPLGHCFCSSLRGISIISIISVINFKITATMERVILMRWIHKCHKCQFIWILDSFRRYWPQVSTPEPSWALKGGGWVLSVISVISVESRAIFNTYEGGNKSHKCHKCRVRSHIGHICGGNKCHKCHKCRVQSHLKHLFAGWGLSAEWVACKLFLKKKQLVFSKTREKKLPKMSEWVPSNVFRGKKKYSTFHSTVWKKCYL